jgi:hypothetical protein
MISRERLSRAEARQLVKDISSIAKTMILPKGEMFVSYGNGFKLTCVSLGEGRFIMKSMEWL